MSSTAAEMSTEDIDIDLRIISEESAVCVGDGTTCVECGKVFSHPFYFSTHIGTHACQKGFVVVGQCALCGLVFSDDMIFAAHMTSSQSQMQKQVPPEDDNLSELGFSDENQELSAHFEEDNSESHQDATHVPDNVNSTLTDELKLKRKRKAPDRFDPDLWTQSALARKDSDPEVDAYLQSLTQMGLTVDPAAFSSHRGGKNCRKDSGRGRGRGRNEDALLEGLRDPSLDGEPPKKASPKYEYLDIDDSSDDDCEFIPVNGKLTRGLRLQQRKERINQTDVETPHQIILDADEVKNEAMISQTDEVFVKKNKTEMVLDKLDESAVNLKCNLSTGDPVANHISDPCRILSSPSSDEESAICKVSHVGSVYEIRTPLVSQVSKHNTFTPLHVLQGHRINSPRTPLVSQVSKCNTFTPLHVSQGHRINSPRTPRESQVSKCNTFTPLHVSQASGIHSHRTPIPQSGSRNTYKTLPSSHIVDKVTHQRNSLTQSVRDKHIIYGNTQPTLFASKNGHQTLSYPQEQKMENRANAVKSSGLMNVDKSSKLEDLKRDARENVQEMLQSIGMVALTSSSLAQKKVFSSPKSKAEEVRFPSSRREDLFTSFNQSCHSRGRFQNRPLGAYKPVTSLQAHHENQTKFWSRPVGGTGPASPLGTLRNNHSIPQRHQNFKNNSDLLGFHSQGVGSSRGAGTVAKIGQHMYNNHKGTIPSAPVRGRMKPTTNYVPSAGVFRDTNKQTKPFQASGDIIVIDDDDDDDIEVINTDKTAIGDNVQLRDLSQGTDKSPCIEIIEERGAGVDDNQECSFSDTKTDMDEEKICESPTSSVLKIVDSWTCENPSSYNASLEDIESDTEVENNLSKSELNRHSRNSTDSVQTEDSKTEIENDQYENKDEGDESLNDGADILPGEDIYGWKVCLAEDSDDDCSASSVNDKTASDEEDSLKQDQLSPPHINTCTENPPHIDTCLESPPYIETYTESPPHIETCTESPPHIETCTGNPPHIDTCLESPPYIETCSESPPHIETCSENPPHIKTCTESPPHIKTCTETPPYIETCSESPPHIETCTESPPHIKTCTETPPHIETCLESSKQKHCSSLDIETCSESPKPVECSPKQDHLSPSYIETGPESQKQDDYNPKQNQQSTFNIENNPDIPKRDDRLSCHSDPNRVSQKLSQPSAIQVGNSPESSKQDIWSSLHKSLASLEQENSLSQKDDLNQLDTDILSNSEQTNIRQRCKDLKDNTKRRRFSEMPSVFESEACFDRQEGDCHSLISSSESCTKLLGVNSLSPPPSSSSSVSCSDGQTSYHSIDSMCDSFTSHSVISHTSVTSTDFLRGDNSLLDIFTEIEKTCKEMEKTLENEGGSQTEKEAHTAGLPKNLP